MKEHVRRVAAWVLTLLATALVLFALIAPNDLDDLDARAFLRIPVEALVFVALLLALPARARRYLAIPAGALLGALTLVKVADMGFLATLDRPFNLVLDWSFFGNAKDFLDQSFGRTGAVAAVVAAVVLAIAVPVLMTLAALRLTRLIRQHPTAATRTTAAFTVAWISFLVLGVQIAPDVPVAALTYDRAQQVRAGLNDKEEFAKLAAVDHFLHTPDDQLLTALRGKDILLTFVESYGRDAVEDPVYATQVGALLAEGNRRLVAAGYHSRSGWLTSSTTGGGSWLAQSTLTCGLWINNQQRYNNLVSSDRMTLNSAFRRAGWRTVAVKPGITRAWPEGDFFGYDKVYDLRNIGYRGPGFGFATMPDQFALSAFQRNEYGTPGRGPVMAEIALLSSHNPWAPIPRMVGWDEVGDGSIFHEIKKEGFSVDEVWKDDDRVREEYRRSIEYSLNTLISYVETYGKDNLVLVFLGDHQASPLIVGENASRDVPITIVAHDPAVLDRISSWGWQDGLKPTPQSPVWRMDEFRDNFLTAYG
ncbi:sulfatase [Phytohabitans rumicis]|uniref:Sulfatase n=1 Tax=Phytohabitans rumicis TaxID=1076125 RepID=A0A6V8LNA7_9ACTN|nr:sulfatase [Phytohabitans rumicis]GFJ94155.1 hypothetical protein Prum_077970 [Phytohabitans rumicis]